MSFDRLAPYYRWMELMLAGGKMHRCRTAFLGQIPAPKQILLLGEGHGRSLVEYRHRFAEAQITCVDASERMLTQARRKLARHNLEANQVEFIHADALNWTPRTHHYDLLVTNFFLDCFRPDQLEQIIFKIATGSTPDANWLLADFQTPGAGWKGLRSRLILRLLYVFFRMVTRLPAHRLTKPDLLLTDGGFKLRHRIENEWGLLHSDWWSKETSSAAQP